MAQIAGGVIDPWNTNFQFPNGFSLGGLSAYVSPQRA